MGFGDQRCLYAVVPSIVVGGREHGLQSFDRWPFAAYRWDADDAVRVRQGEERFAGAYPLALFGGQFHVRILFGGPAVAEQAGQGDLQYRAIDAEHTLGRSLVEAVPLDGAARMAVEDPLRGGVRVGAREGRWGTRGGRLRSSGRGRTGP